MKPPFGIESLVRDKCDAFSYVQTFFTEDEDYLCSQWLPRFYCITKRTLFAALAYAAVFFASFSIDFSVQISIIVLWLYLALVLGRAFCIRTMCGNLLVVTNRAIYRYFRIQEDRVDEFRWESVGSITIRPWHIAPSYATVVIRRRRRKIRELPSVRKLFLYRDRYRRPEALDFRALSLTMPHAMRIVVRNHGELYERCRQLREAEGYTYVIRKKGNRHAKRKADRTRAA